MDEQEIPGKIGGVPYWEGACKVANEKGKIIGKAYLELSGYSGDLKKRLN
jgi:predicted secreted hydrolase